LAQESSEAVTMLKHSLLIAICMASSPAALADGCDSAQTQTDMTNCAHLAYKKADAELNSAYRDLATAYKKIDEFALPALTKTQRAWISLRDAECELEGLGTQGGSIQPMIIAQCLERLTLERITWVRRKLSCEEGDLTCLQLGNEAD
jgi:uncharacterized protein YecT (DUF1311 family)